MQVVYVYRFGVDGCKRLWLGIKMASGENESILFDGQPFAEIWSDGSEISSRVVERFEAEGIPYQVLLIPTDYQAPPYFLELPAARAVVADEKGALVEGPDEIGNTVLKSLVDMRSVERQVAELSAEIDGDLEELLRST